MTIPRLVDEEVKARLQALPGWALRNRNGKLLAREQDHHPEWLNVFDRVVRI
jgi:pterin-4a-carbinolamine dehydratase